MLKFFVLCFIEIFICICAAYKSELVTVLAICRHGMRAPSGTYNNDPFKDVPPWGVEYGQLINYGKMQHYNLGQWFRKRYDGFLPKKYFRKDFLAFSTNVDRCIESAAACAAGLYPPEKSDLFDPNLNWLPIPIHGSKDDLLHDVSRCPKHKKLLEELYKREEYKKILKENEKFLDYVSEMSGEKIKTLYELRLLFGIIYVQSFFNVTFPDWIQNSFEKMHRLSRLELMSYTYTPAQAKLATGVMFNRMLNVFEMSLVNGTTSVKFILYIVHEGTLVDLLNTMKIYDHHWPGFAEAIIFELRKDDKKNFINMLFKNSSGLTRMSLKNCEFSCELGKFQDILAPMRLSQKEWEIECYN